MASTIEAKATYSSVTGTYTTGQWTTGTNTAIWTAPSDGLYIVWMLFALDDSTSSATHRGAYKQLQINGNATKLVSVVAYWDMAEEGSGVRTRLLSEPVLAKTGQTIYPYIHTDQANLKYNITITAIKIA